MMYSLCPESSQDTYEPKDSIICKAQSYQYNLHKVVREAEEDVFK